MPKTPRDFSQGLIYSIVCKTDASLLYVGSTTNLTQRTYLHKNTCNNENSKGYNYQVYVMIRANGGWENFVMKPIKEFPCENNIQLTIEEERIRVEIQAKLNTNRAYRSPEQKQEYHQEYYQNNEHMKEQQKEYRETHKEAIKEYYQKNKETIKEYYQINKEAIKEYYQQNKETIKEYYQINKEAINEKRNKHLKCECGTTVLVQCMTRHRLTKKHMELIALTAVKH